MFRGKKQTDADDAKTSRLHVLLSLAGLPEKVIPVLLKDFT